MMNVRFTYEKDYKEPGAEKHTVGIFIDNCLFTQTFTITSAMMVYRPKEEMMLFGYALKELGKRIVGASKKEGVDVMTASSTIDQSIMIIKEAE